MVGPFPKRPDGRNPESLFTQAAWDHLNGISRRIEVEGRSVNKTTRGSYELPDSGGGGGGGSSTTIKQYSLIDVQDDYLICLNMPSLPVDGDGHVLSGLSNPRFLGSFRDENINPDGKIILDPTATPDPLLYSSQKNDSLWNQTKKQYRIFTGTSWIPMKAAKGTKVYIAKEQMHRTSNVARGSMNEQFTFTYQASPFLNTETWAIGIDTRFNKVRRKFDVSRPGSFEDQIITPAWSEGELIFGIAARTDVVRQVFKDNGASVLDADSNVMFKQPGDPVLDGDSNPTFAAVSLLIYGRSCQWSGPVT